MDVLGPDRPPRAELAHGLGLWRDGERLLRRPMAPGWREDYERAITTALHHLQRYRTMPELLAAYFDDTRASGKDAWLDSACRAGVERVLNSGIVEDAAFWRRARQLIAAGSADQ